MTVFQDSVVLTDQILVTTEVIEFQFNFIIEFESILPPLKHQMA